MIEAVVYFAGPMSVWGDTPAEAEYIAQFTARWEWLAHARARALHNGLSSGRCGYFVKRDGTMLVHVQAQNLTTQGPA